MNSILQDYEQEYSTTTAEITTLCGKLKVATTEEEVNQLGQRISQLFGDADETLEQIELESHHQADARARQKTQDRIASYKKELARLKSLYESCRRDAKERCTRLELFTTSADGMGDTDERDLLLGNEEILAGSGEQLDRGRRLLQETEDIGAGVLSDLGRQKETIQKSRGRLRDVEAGLGQSSTLLSRMVFRAQQNKIVLLLLAGLIVLILMFGIYRIATRH